MTINEAFEAFEIDELLSEHRSPKTIDSYRCAKRSLVKSIGEDIHIGLLVYGHIIQWKKDMYDRDNTGAHMALQLRELRRVLTYLKGHGFATLDASEIKIPRYKNNKTGWLTIKEIQKFLSVIETPRDKAIFAAMFSSGARISELLSLNVDSIKEHQVEVDGKLETVGIAKVIGKGSEPGELNFDEKALKAVNAYLATREDDLEPMFISRQHRRISVQQCIVLTHQYLKKAGIERNGVGATHIIRHSFATDLEVSGQGISGIAVQMRHKQIATTKRYMHGEKLIKSSDYKKYHTSTPVKV